jgi:hypothetical protein
MVATMVMAPQSARTRSPETSLLAVTIPRREWAIPQETLIRQMEIPQVMAVGWMTVMAME